MEPLPIPQSILQKSPTHWTVKNRHDLRIYLRRLRLQIQIARRIELKKVQEQRFKILRKLTKSLLEESGQIRDMDVILKKIPSSISVSLPHKKRLSHERDQKISNLAIRWTKQKRQDLLTAIDWFNKKILKKILENELRELIKMCLEEVKEQHPQTKEEWHGLRKLVRRINYLYYFLGLENKFLADFQKKLGDWHDTELTPAKYQNQKKNRLHAKWLENKNREILKKFKKSFS